MILYLMDGVHLRFLAIGGLLAFERILTGLLEVPLGVATDRWGRRRVLTLCFAALTVSFVLFWLAAQQAEPLAWLLRRASAVRRRRGPPFRHAQGDHSRLA
ncbi:MAG: hypothetical protein AB7K09_15200 [Planctomycetota bacterium]